MESKSKHKRNLFEIDNARNMSKQQLVKTFVPTQSFWRLLSAKNHVVLGSRGSGKTALAKMLSHDHLVLLEDQRAQSAIRDQEFIGIYVPTHLEWVGGLKNKPWQTEEEQELLFQWRLNITACMAFIPVVKSCIETYVLGRGQQARCERELSLELSKEWTSQEAGTLNELYKILDGIDKNKRMQLAESRATGKSMNEFSPVGLIFSTDLFYPLRRGISIISDKLSINKECTWLVCLDEAEFLEELHHRILNTYMRAQSGNLFFKITTMPYRHYTLETNTGVNLDVGDDFEYVSIDSDPTLTARTHWESYTIGTQFARSIFSKRADMSGQNIKGITIQGLLGKSQLLDFKDDGWDKNSCEMKLLEKYCNEKTIERAHRLLNTKKFKQEISRKIHGALLLRQEYEACKGHYMPVIYSGVTLVIRCGDSNPRRMIKIFNALLLATSVKSKKRSRYNTRNTRPKSIVLSPKEQTRILRKFSETTLNYVQCEPEYGLKLYDFLRKIGAYLQYNFHAKLLSTDLISAIEIDNSISDEDWEIIKCAVGHSYLCPKIGPDDPDHMPQKEGVFHLANALAPYLFLLPRRGKSHKLSTIINESRKHNILEELPLFDKEKRK